MTINEMKQSYKQSYTDNVELSIFNCGHEYCQPGHTWGAGVRVHYLIHLVVAGKGVYQVNGASHTLQEGDLFLCGMTPAELEEKLGVPLVFTENDGADFLYNILGI